MRKFTKITVAVLTFCSCSFAGADTARTSLMKYSFEMERAEYSGDMAPVRALLANAQIDVNGISNNLYQPYTALIWTLQKGYVKVFSELLQAPELDPNLAPQGLTPDGNQVVYDLPFRYAAEAADLTMARALWMHPRFEVNRKGLANSMPIMSLVARFYKQKYEHADTTETTTLMRAMIQRPDLNPVNDAKCYGTGLDYVCDTLLWNVISGGMKDVLPVLLARSEMDVNLGYVLIAALKRSDDPFFAETVFSHPRLEKNKLYRFKSGPWDQWEDCSPAGIAIMFKRSDAALVIARAVDANIYTACKVREYGIHDESLFNLAVSNGGTQALIDAVIAHPAFSVLHESAPLAVAANQGRADLVRRLLATPGVDWKSEQGKTQLGFAMASSIRFANEKNNVEVIQALLPTATFMINDVRLGCHQEGGSRLYCDTALTLAADSYKDGRMALLQTLLAVPGIDVNKRNDDRNAPLHIVVGLTSHLSAEMEPEKRMEGMLRTLLGVRGIDVNARGYDGTALSMAQQAKLEKFSKIIKRAGGNAKASWEP